MKLNCYIENAIIHHEEKVSVTNDIQEKDVRDAIRWVMRRNPNVFWFAHQYHFDAQRKEITFDYQFSKDRCDIIQNSINDVIKHDFQIEYVNTLDIYSKIMYVYKWLLSYCNYNINSAYNQSIYSVFVRRNSVCTGYAKAAQYLFDLIGIESRLVFGRLNNDVENGRHCWNIVCIEGTYYHYDVCLGDPALEYIMTASGNIDVLRYGSFNYNCFCVSTEKILETRSIEDIESLPICDKSLLTTDVKKLSLLSIKKRTNNTGCLLSHIGSSADIHLCSKDKNVVLKVFREPCFKQCMDEYKFMDALRGCKHLLQLNDTYTDISNNIIALEQSIPIVDLFCSHYYHPTLYGVLTAIRDIIHGWLECYERGILYRDFHVCNIYKANNGLYILGDFGSCTYRQYGRRERVGNIWFMSPETYINGIFNERSAIYSISSVLYFILNGLRPPFSLDFEETEALQKKLNGESFPIPLLLYSFPQEQAMKIMDRIIDRGCAFMPSKRFPSLQILLSEINALMSEIKNDNITLQFSQSFLDSINDTHALTADIVNSTDEKFCNEEVEKMVTTFHSIILSEETSGMNEFSCDDFVAHSATDDVENYCRTMGIQMGNNLEGNISNITIEEPPQSYHKCSRGHYYPASLSHCPFCDTDFLSDDESSNTGKYTFMYDEREDSYNLHTCMSDPDNPNIDETTYLPHVKKSIFDLFRKKRDKVYASIFAPAEITRKSRMLVQIYLHLAEETEIVTKLAIESQREAKRRDYIPLLCQLKKGDKVDALLQVYGETLLYSEKKSIVWQGSFTKCSFDYFVPKDIEVDALSCTAILTVNDIPIGEMRFVTNITNTPGQMNSEILAHKYRKVFVSYAHKDEAKVKSFHEGLKLCGIEHFYDRDYLRTGDVFPKVIQDYINSADLFVLFWSENAAHSEYVDKERKLALSRAYPQVRPQKAAKLSIYPMSIEPRAELPVDMKEMYHFGII